MLFCRDYAKRVLASFPHQIQPGYYGGNRSVSIEDVALEHFSAFPQTGINSSKISCPRHAVFHYFLSDDRKQYSATATAHIKRFIELLKKY